MRLNATLALVLVLLAAGCSSKVGGLPPGTCRDDRDCQVGICGPTQECIPECSRDLDCGPNAHCENQACRPGSRPGGDGGGGLPDAGGGTGDGGFGVLDGGGGGSDGGRAEQCNQLNARRGCGETRGTCVPGTQVCDGEFWGPCVGAIGPTEEECDGRDHNCDGIPNNRPGGCECQNGETRPCYNGPPGTEGVGTCRAGEQTCVDGTWGSCAGAIEPQPGNCGVPSCTGGPNPGCDCVIGQGRPCYSGPTGTAGVGICRAGTQLCVASAGGSRWDTCEGERAPEDELCDGQDHNCNNIPNDRPGGCVCDAGQVQSCYTGPPETLGLGSCAAGSQSCVVGTGGGPNAWAPCTGDVKPQPGNCDALSCTGALNPGCACLNGTTQPCYTGPTGTLGNGICVGGNQTCVAGAWASCTGQTLPQAQDSCAPANAGPASYNQFRQHDLNCNGVLNRRNPVAAPTATAVNRSGQTLSNITFTPPAGFVYAFRVPPLANVTLQGGATDADGPGTFSYEWRLLSAPPNNTAGIQGAPGGTPNDISTLQNPRQFAQLVGVYQVGVRAIDSTGCRSDEVKVWMEVIPENGIHLELSWDQPLDLDLQVTNGAGTAFSLTPGSSSNCFWGTTSITWSGVSCALKIDDLIGCNPEDITLTGTPAEGATYGIYAHVYCNHRGHYRSGTTSGYACYETRFSSTVNATLRAYVDGAIMQVDTLNTDAIFTRNLGNGAVWRVATLSYTAGRWHIARVDQLQTAQPQCSDGSGEASCVCGNAAVDSTRDPYCGPTGAACRQRYP